MALPTRLVMTCTCARESQRRRRVIKARRNGPHLAQTEGIADEQVGNIRFDGIHEVELALRGLDR